MEHTSFGFPELVCTNMMQYTEKHPTLRLLLTSDSQLEMILSSVAKTPMSFTKKLNNNREKDLKTFAKRTPVLSPL